MAPGAGFAELRAVASLAAWAARGEVGWRPREGVALFGFGEASGRWGGPVEAVAGVGGRVAW